MFFLKERCSIDLKSFQMWIQPISNCAPGYYLLLLHQCGFDTHMWRYFMILYYDNIDNYRQMDIAWICMFSVSNVKNTYKFLFKNNFSSKYVIVKQRVRSSIWNQYSWIFEKHIHFDNLIVYGYVTGMVCLSIWELEMFTPHINQTIWR